MKWPRISIGRLMVIVLAIGVGIVALRLASPDSSGGMLLATLGVLGVGILGAWFRRGSSRASWAGFALFGWGYLIVTCGPWFASEVEPQLATSRGLVALHAIMHAGRDFERATITAGPNVPYTTVQDTIKDLDSRGIAHIAFAPAAVTPNAGPSVLIVSSNLAEFVRIGHCLFALIAGLIGGMIAVRFQKAEERSPCPDAAR